jgi:predicted PurR-regulated permease PerM
MFNNVVNFLLTYNYMIIACVVIIKTVLFFVHKSDRWRFNHFFYFDDYELHRTTNAKRKLKKRLQNILSIIALTLFFLQIILLVTID